MNAEPITLRPYQDDELPQMLALIRAAFAEYAGRLDPPSSAEHKTLAALRVELQLADALVADQAGLLVGCVLYRRQSDAVYLDRLSVLPSHRGQHIGDALLAGVEAAACRMSAKALTLSVRLTLAKQQAYYRRRGFQHFEDGTHPGFSAPTFSTLRKPLSTITEDTQS